GPRSGSAATGCRFRGSTCPVPARTRDRRCPGFPASRPPVPCCVTCARDAAEAAGSGWDREAVRAVGFASMSPISFMDPEVQRCPFPAYEAVRKEGPVYRDPLTGWYVVTSYEEARKYTGDTVNLSNDTGFLFNRQSQDEHHQERVDRIWQEEGFPRVPALVVVDPPDHTFHRSFINKSFTPYRVRLMEDYLETVVDEMIDDFIDADEVDFKSELAIKVPLAVIADQLGMPRSDLDKLHFWSDSILEHLDPTISDEREIELTKVICELHQYASAKVEEY